MDSAELLAQLADIHLPPAISFWPPAIGWWILAMVLLALFVQGMRQLLRSRKQRKICAFALEELNRIYRSYQQSLATASDVNHCTLDYVNALNAVLRRVALWNFPEAGIASLGGQAWVDFIKEKGEASALSEELSIALREGRFKPRCEVDVNALHSFGRQWISHLYMQKFRSLPVPATKST
jgi:hypothetical protein